MIGINIAANSWVGRDMGEAKDSPIKMTLPSVAAQTIIDGMEKNNYRFLIGSDAKMMDFLSHLNPKQAAKLIYKQVQSIVSN